MKTENPDNQEDIYCGHTEYRVIDRLDLTSVNFPGVAGFET